jgi:F-type H+-transporting ATPase subunit delta
LLSFVSPYEVIAENLEIDSVTVPGTEGRFGIVVDHVPTISQLTPGVVEFVNKEKNAKKYFVGAGFVAVHPNSTCHVSVTECFPIEDMDKQQAQNGLEEAKKDLQAAPDEKSKVENRIRVETFEKILEEIV